MLTLLLALALTSPRVSLPSSGGGHTIEDEGTPLTTRATLNFVGAGVSCTDTGAKTQCSIAGGGAGSTLTEEVQVDFGAVPGTSDASTAVSGGSGTATTRWSCSVTGLATADRAEGAEDGLLEELTAQVSNRNAGGFTLKVHVPRGRALGKYLFHCVGA